MWIDFNGRPVEYVTLAPGQTFTISTYMTHPWMFTDDPGICIEMFMPQPGLRSFAITASNRNFGPEQPLVRSTWRAGRAGRIA